MEAAERPLPREETTPPVMKMYFGPLACAFSVRIPESAGCLLFTQNSPRDFCASEGLRCGTA